VTHFCAYLHFKLKLVSIQEMLANIVTELQHNGFTVLCFYQVKSRPVTCSKLPRKHREQRDIPYHVMVVTPPPRKLGVHRMPMVSGALCLTCALGHHAGLKDGKIC
jgi:hypothetical protein